jgi:hypothetical protein
LEAESFVPLRQTLDTTILLYGYAFPVLLTLECMPRAAFDWNPKKDFENQAKHGVSFETAQHAFADPRRVIAEDLSHSAKEKRYYCFGMVGGGVLTVRFTFRGRIIRIFGAAYWRKGKRIYEQTNPIH